MTASATTNLRSVTPAPTGFRLEWVAAGQNAKDKTRQKEFDTRHGARDLLTETFTRAGIPAVGRRVQVTHAFQRSSKMPTVSGVLADKHGVRLRIRPDKKDQGYMVVVLCNPGETPESLYTRLEPAARAISGGLAEEPLPDPESETVYRRAADLAGGLDPAESLAAFAVNLAAEAGPGESPSYWMKALCAAETNGLVYRNGTGFYPVDPEAAQDKPAPIPVPAPVPVVVAPEPASAPIKADGRTEPDMEAVDLLANSAGAMIAALSRIQSLKEERRKLMARRIELERDIAQNARDLREAAKVLDIDTLNLAAQALRE